MDDRLYTIAETCAVAKTSRTTVNEAIAEFAKTSASPAPSGLRAVKRGRRTLVLAEDLERWIKSLPEVTRPRPHAAQNHAEAAA
jgi:hypothetical protein